MRSRRGLLLLTLVLAVAWASSDRFDAPAVAPDGRLDVVLITVDCLRADHTGCGGYGRDTTPVLDGLARKGVCFETALATCDWTLPSLASILSGLPPSRHGAVRTSARLMPEVRTLAECMQERGYATAGFVASVFGDPDCGLGQGFSIFNVCINIPRDLPAGAPPPSGVEDANAALVADRAVRWLQAPPAGPRFLWVHFLDPHYPYAQREPYFSQFHPSPAVEKAGDPDFRFGAMPNGVWPGGEPMPERFRETMIALYDSEVRYTDEAIGRVLAQVDLAHTFVAIAADHGEQLRERGWIGHGLSCSRQELHVPLVLAGAGVPQGRRVRTAVSLVDLYSTLLTAADASGFAPPDGAPLERFFGSFEPESGPIYSDDQVAHYGDRIYSVFEAGSRAAQRFDGSTGSLMQTSFYDWKSDPQELSEAHDPGTVQQLELLGKLDRWIGLMQTALRAGGDPTGRDIRLGPGRLAQLRDLGYLR
ncbi:MAG: sulfatase [Candidatus Wallbacteria bacterium]|nr:sulfatase [Candidatus Wallbacteria bacterium]